MTQLIFTQEKTAKSLGYIGGGVEKFPSEFWAKIPNSDHYQTHLLTLYPDFYHESEQIENHRISIFVSLENHALGGVTNSLTNNYTVNQKAEISHLKEPYAVAIFYQIDDSIAEYNLSDFSLPRKFFHEMDRNSPEYAVYRDNEHNFFEKNGMGLEVSKLRGIFYFVEDKIMPPPKYSPLLQLLEEDVETSLRIFQRGIGYFFLDRNLKKLKSGDKAGLFFIQN